MEHALGKYFNTTPDFGKMDFLLFSWHYKKMLDVQKAASNGQVTGPMFG